MPGFDFFFLAVLLLALCGLCSAAQHINAAASGAAASMAEAPGPQLAGNSLPQAFAAPGLMLVRALGIMPAAALDRRSAAA